MTITCSTKVCSFGKQVVEKVETEYARYENGRFVYRIHRSPMCEYMINFIHKLKHLPEKYMMNSVLENFTILQVLLIICMLVWLYYNVSEWEILTVCFPTRWWVIETHKKRCCVRRTCLKCRHQNMGRSTTFTGWWKISGLNRSQSPPPLTSVPTPTQY